jgi:mannose-6-phosphate isomerase-like protein (cupin superfamily)
MSTAYPYTTNYDAAFGPLELIDIAKVRDRVTVDWFNQTLCQVNDSVIRLGVVKGEYHWHKHDKEDEFFFVVDGVLLIDLEGETVELRPNQGFTIPRGVLHRTRALERTTILMVEPKTVVATGD